eukprot:c133_g1_i1.p1 GENE.c133_g1_i1~~c133_g1_i1.p1  ORF type:complete len:182 (+),score=27.17 c133_g1_i1:38-547(+)
MAEQEHDAQGANAADGEELLSAPTVFQCANCRTIVGDSLAFVGSSEELHTITLSAVRAVSIAKTQPVTSTQLPDVGCTYFLLYCGHCEERLGRMYNTTSRKFDALRCSVIAVVFLLLIVCPEKIHNIIITARLCFAFCFVSEHYFCVVFVLRKLFFLKRRKVCFSSFGL